jgi:hypothetical protein
MPELYPDIRLTTKENNEDVRRKVQATIRRLFIRAASTGLQTSPSPLDKDSGDDGQPSGGTRTFRTDEMRGSLHQLTFSRNSDVEGEYGTPKSS